MRPLILHEDIFMLTDYEACFPSFHSTHSFSTFYFISKIAFLFGKLSEKLYIPNCVKNTLSLLSQIFFSFPSYVKPVHEKKIVLKSSSKTQKSHQSWQIQASHSPVLPLTSGCGSALSAQRPLGSAAYLCLECGKALACGNHPEGLDEKQKCHLKCQYASQHVNKPPRGLPSG